ncbi:hypothetical protein PGT21_032108 [Puccinia graminis f. sp. tritici]|uniref:Uncharacterized protein n=1 Tax=Puccinia graminis f. sp. tritici TaxID=56615 RepID=A0A5B0PSS8_PUCGR|nr:hypothetical protein PGTUg99_012304 [Puccinia graminis f. sp. tritici]KAA1104807.1 hypothetical protein PGT21_032108 [Puccinia graminis f. sp. tritici]
MGFLEQICIIVIPELLPEEITSRLDQCAWIMNSLKLTASVFESDGSLLIYDTCDLSPNYLLSL